MTTPPPPGVSTTGQNVTQISRPHRSRSISPDAPPLGASVQTRRQVQEIDLPLAKRANQYSATFKSIDGMTYSFRTHDTKGKPLAHRNQLCIFLCMVEISAGGNPSAVLDAFRTKIVDQNSKQIYPRPIPDPVPITGTRPLGSVNDDELSVSPEFSLASDDN